MIYHMNSVADIREELSYLLREKEFVVDKSGVNTVEIINACFVADEPVIFGNLNQDYIEREKKWYRSQSLNVNDIPRASKPLAATPSPSWMSPRRMCSVPM